MAPTLSSKARVLIALALVLLLVNLPTASGFGATASSPLVTRESSTLLPLVARETAESIPSAVEERAGSTGFTPGLPGAAGNSIFHWDEPRLAGYWDFYMLPDGQGGVYVAWSSGTGNVPNAQPPYQGQTFVQRYNGNGDRLWSSGNELWGTNDLLLSGTGRREGVVSLLDDGAGGVIVVWLVDDGFDGVYSDLRAQRLSPSGVPLWQAGGVPIVTGVPYLNWGQAVSDGQGGVLAFWYRYDLPDTHRKGSVWGQRIQAGGARAWAAGGVRLSFVLDNEELWLGWAQSDHQGGAYVVWEEIRGGNTLARRQHVDGQGNVRWTGDGQPLAFCFDQGVQIDASRVIGLKHYHTHSLDVYQLNLETGGVEWGPVTVEPDNVYPGRVASDGAGGVYVSWIDSSSGWTACIQRVSAQGQALWGPGVCLGQCRTYYSARIVPDGRGGVYAAWEGPPFGYYVYGLWIQHVDAAGQLLWPEGGVLAAQEISHPKFQPDGSGSAFVAWATGGPFWQGHEKDNPFYLQHVSRLAGWLTVAKQAAPDPVYAGNPLTYTIRITNTDSVSFTMTIIDVLPPQVTTSDPTSWSSVTIPSGNTWTKQLAVTVTGGYSGTLNNVVKVSTVQGATGVYASVARVRAPDLIPLGLEVTQAIQSMTNTVTLLENKRTYARFHVKTNSGITPGASARLSATRAGGALGAPLLPSNPAAAITVTANPDRGNLNDSFYFQLPATWLSGTVQLTAEVNPSSRAVPESNYQGNVFTTTVVFQPSSPLTITVYGVSYITGGITYTVRPIDYDRVESWLRAAYPTGRLAVITKTLPHTFLSLPTAITVNQHLATMHGIAITKTDKCPGSRYYGLVYDGGGLIKGQAVGIPGCIASGPTGLPAGWPGTSWDTDGSYGDWYAGHELGHTLGRYHAEFCGALLGRPYPYPHGLIGGPATDPKRFYGFDVVTRAIYTPTLWTELMTYCDYQWISDFTYEGIRRRLITETTGMTTTAALDLASADGYLLVWGTMNLTQNSAQLGTLYRLPDLTPSNRPATSAYTLRLLDGGDALLAEYPFLFKEDTEPLAGEDLTAVIYEIVPYVAGTARVVVAHEGTELTSKPVSANPPQVTVLSPNGGETLGEWATATWSGNDPDGDPLAYALLYSADDGATWTAVAAEIAGTHLTFPTSELAGSDLGRIRVLVSDGVNTAWDDSDGSFHLPRKAPAVSIISPGSGESYLREQTVILDGQAYDREDGYLDGSALVWLSNLDGTLGTGRSVAVTGLSLGEHIITLRATDSDALTGTATLKLYIRSGLRQLYLPLALKQARW